jgi:hypothetical protein
MMRSQFFFSCLVAIALPVFGGCNSGVVQDQILEANAPDPLADARSLLNAYLTNPAVGSEATDFDDLVARVSGVDADKGAKLEQFLVKAKTSGRVSQSAAKKLLAEFE